MAKKVKGYKIVKPVFFNNTIVESKAQAYRLAKHFKVKKSEIKLKRYIWSR